MSRYYLAGPMSGVPQFNFPAFQEAAAFLRKHANPGTEIVSPEELDKAHSEEGWASAMASKTGNPKELKSTVGTWGEVLARDVHLVADQIDAIIFLDEWWKSRGARLEAFVGLLCGKQFLRLVYAFEFRDYKDDPCGPEDVHHSVRGPLIDIEEVGADYVREMLRTHMP